MFESSKPNSDTFKSREPIKLTFDSKSGYDVPNYNQKKYMSINQAMQAKNSSNLQNQNNHKKSC